MNPSTVITLLFNELKLPPIFQSTYLEYERALPTYTDSRPIQTQHRRGTIQGGQKGGGGKFYQEEDPGVCRAIHMPIEQKE